MPRPHSKQIRIFLTTLTLVVAAALVGTARQRSARLVSGHPRLPFSSNQDVYTISDNVNLVLLDVSARDPRGGYVTGLTKDDFHVFEDGRLQKITQFGSVDTPVTVGLVVDNSGSMRLKRPQVVLAGLAFAKGSNPKDEFFVVNFNNRVLRGLPDRIAFTDDLQTLRAALYYGTPMGQTALYDAIAYSLKHLELSRQDKRTLVVVSDGGDNVSRTSYPELVKLIEASLATIYTVGLFDPEDTDCNPKVLRKLAKVSGGQFFEPAKLEDVIPVFHKISDDIRNRYAIGYVPPDLNTKRPLRSVRVIAAKDHRKLVVRTRTAYTITPFSELMAQQSQSDGQGKEK